MLNLIGCVRKNRQIFKSTKGQKKRKVYYVTVAQRAGIVTAVTAPAPTGVCFRVCARLETKKALEKRSLVLIGDDSRRS